MDVLETMDKWSRVRTADGYIGYVENRKLEAGEQIAPVSTFEAPVYTSISMDGKVRLGFHQVTRQEEIILLRTMRPMPGDECDSAHLV